MEMRLLVPKLFLLRYVAHKAKMNIYTLWVMCVYNMKGITQTGCSDTRYALGMVPLVLKLNVLVVQIYRRYI